MGYLRLSRRSIWRVTSCSLVGGNHQPNCETSHLRRSQYYLIHFYSKANFPDVSCLPYSFFYRGNPTYKIVMCVTFWITCGDSGQCNTEFHGIHKFITASPPYFDDRIVSLKHCTRTQFNRIFSLSEWPLVKVSNITFVCISFFFFLYLQQIKQV